MERPPPSKEALCEAHSWRAEEGGAPDELRLVPALRPPTSPPLGPDPQDGLQYATGRGGQATLASFVNHLSAKSLQRGSSGSGGGEGSVAKRPLLARILTMNMCTLPSASR